MSKIELRVKGEGRETLELALRIAFGENRKAVAWKEREGVLILYWATDLSTVKNGAFNFPSPITYDVALHVVEKWLENTKYGPEPSHDGSNEEGFEVFNERHGKVDGDWRAFVAIRPVWIEYGK